MEYTCSYNPTLNTIEVFANGVANLTSLIEIEHQVAELCSKEKSANILADYSEVEPGPLTLCDIDTLGGVTVSLRDIFKMRKCAHIVATGVQYGLVRAWEIIIETKGFMDIETRVFKKRSEAIEWIKTAPHESTHVDLSHISE